MESTAGARLQDGARALFWTRPWYALGHRLTPAKRLYMNENAVRARAGLLHVTGWTVLLLALLYSDSVFLQKTIAPVVLWDFVAAAAVGLTPLSPFGVAGTALTWAQPPVWTPAGPKRFAWSIGALLVAACVALAVLRLKAAALATVVACMLFTWLEAALGFCLGCWVWNVVAPALGLGEPCHACEGGVCPMPPAPPAGRARAVAPPPLPPTPAPRTPPSTPPTSGAGACQDMGAANSPTGSSNGEPGPHLCGPRVVTVVVADGSPQHPPLDCGLPVSAMDSAAEEEGDPLEALGQPPETPVPPAAPPGVPYGGGLEEYFAKYRRHIVGHEHPMQTRSGQTVALLYADWTASGRLYHPIERFLTHDVGPMVGNPHTEASLVGAQMTRAYESARAVVRRHVNAGPEDVVLFVGSGMTGALSKLLDFTGLRVARARPKRRAVRQCRRAVHTRARPVVFISHFEHHSNQLPWQELDVDVRIVDRGADGRPDLGHLGRLLRRYRHRTTKIGAFSACSNVTGIRSDCHALAAAMHRHGGVCVVDFACSAPYVAIDMRPADPSGRLDAIVFSAHKFLGGPGGTGVLVCAPGLYAAPRPTMPGGGTVAFSNPWGDVVYHSGIEAREDAGTPPYLQAIKTALAIKVKEVMDPCRMHLREQQLVDQMFAVLDDLPDVHVLEGHVRDRLPIFSFYFDQYPHNLVGKLLNDFFGVQCRGGCSCAGTYAHVLFGVDRAASLALRDRVVRGDCAAKPGWVRISLHPTTTDREVQRIGAALQAIVRDFDAYSAGYAQDTATGEFLLHAPSLLERFE